MSEATRGGDAMRAITETASISPLRLRRPEIRLSVGLLAGLLFGTLLGYVMVLLPGDLLLGPYPAYPKQMAYSMAVGGACCGLPPGWALAAGVLLWQRGWRGRGGVVAIASPVARP